ncbi:MAG TPA: 50S ribosomal protein L4 [Candidatus Andersenbacteria bacterium]|nr:50S ribosomal protein L4 [Candidatus Andersenbacteria bacterium]
MAKKSTTQELPVLMLGSKTSKETLAMPEYIVGVDALELIARTIHTTNRRMRIRKAHTKERSEVQGGGRKPWKQKGTGRSRHGSTRSPIWVGGGISFGPRSRKTSIRKTQLRERRRAFSGVLAMHAKNASLMIMRLEKDMPLKTKDVAKDISGKAGLLVIIDETHKQLERAMRNVPTVHVRYAHKVLISDVIKAHEVWIDEAALHTIETRCAVH